MLAGCWLTHTIGGKKTNSQRPKKKKIIVCSALMELCKNTSIYRLRVEVKLSGWTKFVTNKHSCSTFSSRLMGFTIRQIEVRNHCRMQELIVGLWLSKKFQEKKWKLKPTAFLIQHCCYSLHCHLHSFRRSTDGKIPLAGSNAVG